MALNEVFPNPTVKEVIFQIRFPNLFYLESKIGDFQIKIMKEFPQSQLLLRRPIMFTGALAEAALKQSPQDSVTELTRKIWRFQSPKGVLLHVQSDSLDLTSQAHSTYRNPASPDRFRDAISLVLDSFLTLTSLPVISRIGLRYIDLCPIPALEETAFRSYYNTTLPIGRFHLDSASEMEFKTTVTRGDYKLKYGEALHYEGNTPHLKLDFDGFAENIEPAKCLDVTDNLHSLINAEYEMTIKKPVLEHMRKPKGA